jgi:hypothetical protein
VRARLFIRFVAGGLLALMTAGCSEFRGVLITGDLDQPTVSVARAGSDRAMRACIDWIAVFDTEQGPGPRRAVWRVRSADDRCVQIGSIVYGQTPDGFIVDTPAQPLRAGTIYDAGGHGWTGGFASVPWVGSGRYVFRDGDWRRVDDQP